MKCIFVLPIQFLGPSPKGRYEWFGLLALISSLKFSGLKTSGSGKYFGSWCSPHIGIKIFTPTSRCTDVPGITYGFVTTRPGPGTGGCFLRVSEINNWQICDHAIIQKTLYRMKFVTDHAIILTEKHTAIVLRVVQLMKQVMKIS